MSLPPGPRAPAALQTARWLSQPVGLMERCRDRYGDFFTLRFLGAGAMVFTSDPRAVKELFAADRTNGLPPGRNLVLEPVMGPRSLLLLEGAEHLERRRLMLPPFHGERMRAYADLIEEIARGELERWPLGEPFRLHPRMQAITLEVILRAVFGVEDAQRLAALRSLLTGVLRLSTSPRAFFLGMASRRLGRVGPYRRFFSELERVDALLAEEIGRRRADPRLDERDDILSLLLQARFEDGSAMGDAELRDQLMTLLLAGHETTATALAWTFDLLFRHPATLDRLVAAIEEDGGADYLDATIKESLRLRPVVPQVGRLLAEDAELGGRPFRAGTVLAPSIYLVHTRPESHARPYQFRPARFLDDEVETYGWVPFGGGTRRCLGAAFAQLEMRVVLRTVLGAATLRPASPRAERVVRRNITLSPRGGTPAVLVERRPASEPVVLATPP